MAANEVPGFRPSVHGLPFPNAFPPGPTMRLGPFDPRVIGFGDASAGLCGGMALTARDLYEAGLTAPGGLEGTAADAGSAGLTAQGGLAGTAADAGSAGLTAPGGLAGTAADAGPAGLTAQPAPPVNGSPRFRALVRRQVQSLDWLRVPLRYLDLQALRPDPPAGLAARLHREPPRVEAVLSEWPRIRAEIDSGHPAVVGLIRAAGGSPWTLTRNHQVLAFGWEAAMGRITLRVYDPNHPGRDDVELRATIDDAPPGTPWRDRIRLVQTTGEPLLGFFRQPYPRGTSVRAWRRGRITRD